MSKDKEVAVAEEVEVDPAKLLTEALQGLVMQPGGFPIVIEGEEKPYQLIGGTITGVKVNSAWIMFSHDGCVIRTKEFKDRDAFLKVLTTGGPSTAIRFTKVCGTLQRPAEPEVVKKPFTPRARRGYGRPLWMDNLERSELIAEK